MPTCDALLHHFRKMLLYMRVLHTLISYVLFCIITLRLQGLIRLPRLWEIKVKDLCVGNLQVAIV